MLNRHYDVVIIGAGLSGLTLAASLADSGLRLAMVSRPVAEPNAPLRVSAITPHSQQIWQRLGVWQTPAQPHLSPFLQMEVWDEQGTYIHFDSADIPIPALGYIVANTSAQVALYQVLNRSNTIEDWYYSPLQTLSIQQQGSVILVLADQTCLMAQLIVGADGTQSRVRQLAAIGYTSHDYRQIALVATVRHSMPHHATARQVFLASGPLAFLPLADPYSSSIVWSTHPEHAVKLQEMPAATFCAALARAFNDRLGHVSWTSERLCFPIHRFHSYQYVKPHIALVGDAAHTLHPLAGQGANLSIADASCLAQVILSAHKNKRSIGALHNLRPYERARRSSNARMITVLEAIRCLFAWQHPLIRGVRKLGLQWSHCNTHLKRYLMSYATNNSDLF